MYATVSLCVIQSDPMIVNDSNMLCVMVIVSTRACVNVVYVSIRGLCSLDSVMDYSVATHKL